MAYQPFDLTGSVALVTGGNRGIGLGMATALAQAGADLVLWGRSGEQNDQAAKTLRSFGRRVVTRQVDVTDERQVVEAVVAAVQELGRIDSVFANAGVGGAPVPFIESSTEHHRAVFGPNVDGVYWTLREAARHMVQRAQAGDPGGSLVGVASLAAIQGVGRNQAYAASKGAVVSLVRGVAVELARYSVRVNALLPGWIATDMTAQAMSDPRLLEKVLPRVPLRRWGEPADIGGLAVYLSSSASSYHTGDSFVVDGGYSIF